MDSLSRRVPPQAALILLAGAAALIAMWGGLARMGWVLPLASGTLIGGHGPLMTGGFLGTVIAIERAVALRRGWAFLAPLLSGLGALLLAFGLGAPAGLPLSQAMITLGSLVLVLIFATFYRQHPTLISTLYAPALLAGSICWLAGNALWLLRQPIYVAAHWWMAFLVLTIAGERLELSRVARIPPGAQALFGVASLVLFAGLVTLVFARDAGVRLVGIAYLGFSAWLLFFDIARRTVRAGGHTRFIAFCLLAGYGWLGAGGLLMLAFGGQVAGYGYDAMLHAVFVGFVISMIFGHASLILPSTMGIAIPYRPAFYLPLGLLHASVLLRVTGDLFAQNGVRQWGGMLNATAVVLFLLLAAASGLRERLKPGRV
ncbi:MAG: hypothetical protein IT326_01225 [Anaerolineae bacterium]|nr:hypothetical protein [Anaerolineae bacterium]